MICLKIISGVVILLYCLLMLCYRRGWRLQPLHLADSRFQPRTRISIIIPARNEAGRIGECLRALQAQQYPVDLFEAIVVDDHSEDETISQVQAINAPNIRCIRLADHLDPDEPVVAYKKKALAVGIAVSNGELILTTDADCIAPPGWLSTVAALYEREQPVMVIAPVDFSSDGSLVQLFQSIDFMTMQGITAAAHKLRMGNMSNGANLAFSRDAFEKIGGYAGTEHLASGDDFLLTVKMQQAFPGKIAYLKSAEAIVRTAPQPDWRSFLMQRIRWASKSGKYRDTRLTAVLLLVYLLNLLMVVLAVTALIVPDVFKLLGALFILKLLAELCFLWPVAGFFGKRRSLWLFPLLQPLHILYIVLAGFLGFFGTYTWKGRQITSDKAVEN